MKYDEISKGVCALNDGAKKNEAPFFNLNSQEFL
jgi:hypothetical protein